MRSHPLMTLRVGTAPTQNVGEGPRGTRLTFPMVGGSFEGDRLRGKVLPWGRDWILKRPDGVPELALRITLETDDCALIHMTFEGIRDEERMDRRISGRSHAATADRRDRTHWRPRLEIHNGGSKYAKFINGSCYEMRRRSAGKVSAASHDGLRRTRVDGVSPRCGWICRNRPGRSG
jgi:hypothetical protein